MNELLKTLENSEYFSSAFSWLADYWWAYLPFLLFFSFYFTWLDYIRGEYLDSLKWVLLRIKPPPAVDRSPKGAEQIFAGLHGVFRPVSWKNKVFQGKVPDWFSLEIVGQEGQTNFYIRTLADYKNLVESNVFAQYPDAEITEVEDYMDNWPNLLPGQEYDIFGSEIVLDKDQAYPIQTYPYFEEKMAGLEQIKRIDPLSSVSEIFSTFLAGENFVIQVVITPISDDWTKKAQRVIDGILGKEVKKKENFVETTFSVIDKIFAGAPAKKEEKKDKKLSAPEEEAVKAIGRKMSKIGFETTVRIVYMAKKEIFHRYHFSAVMGALKQFSSPSLNSFKVSSPTITFSKGILYNLFPSDKGFFVDQITFKKKAVLFRKLKSREFAAKKFVLNTEELATIYHLPGIEVKAPLFPRVEAKKGQPPAGLELEL